MERMSNDFESEQTAEITHKNKKKKSWGLWWKLPLLLIVAIPVAGYFLPQILSQPGVLAGLLNTAYKDKQARFEIDGATLAWNQPIALSGLKIHDENGEVLNLGGVNTAASLWDLLQQKSPNYELVISKPHLHLIIDENGTNVERLIDRLSGSDNSDKASVYNVRIKEGTALVEDKVKGEKIDVSNIEADVKYSSANEELMTKTRFDLAHNGQTGKFALDLEPVERGTKFVTQTGDVPLTLLAPVLESKAPGLNLRGILNGMIEGVIPSEANEQGELINIDLSIAGLDVSGEDYLGKSIFSSPDVKIRGSINPQTNAVDLVTQLASWAIDEPVAAGSAERQRIWSNSASELQFRGQYAAASDAFVAEILRLTSTEVSIEITGDIKELSTRQVYDITGRTAIDQRLLDNAVKAKLMSMNVRVDSLKTGNFRLQGPLWQITPSQVAGEPDQRTFNPEFSAATRISWQNIGYETFDLGAGTMDVGMKNNIVSLTPTPLNLLGGRVDLTSAFDITDTNDPIVMVPAGVKIERAGINTELSRRWLLYVSPLFAEATAIEGTFTLELPQIKAKVSQLAMQRSEFALTFHQARLGPGPLMQQVAGMISQMQSTIGREPGRGLGGIVGGVLQPDVQWIGIPEQRVTLVVDQGQVSHRDLAYQVGDVRLVSTGSIGAIDKRLDLNFAMGIPDKWVQNRPLLAGMAGQSVNIAVGGTLSQPQVDLRNMADFGKQIGAGAIGGLIDNLIERRRNR